MTMGNKGSSNNSSSRPTAPSTPPSTTTAARPTPAPTTTPATTPTTAPTNASSTTLASTITTATTATTGSTATLLPKTRTAQNAPGLGAEPRDWDAAYGALAKRMGFGATTPTLPHKTKKDRKDGGAPGA